MGWAFVWMMVVLKIPVVAAIWLVWWASREPDATADDGDGGGSDRRPRRDHPRPRRPGPPRRGPHAEAPPRAPRRVRVHAAGIDRAHPRRLTGGSGPPRAR